jgi:hypothetical protein
MSFGHAVADVPGDEYGVRKIGTVRFSDRAINLFQLEDGTELHTTDLRQFQTFGKASDAPYQGRVDRGFDPRVESRSRQIVFVRDMNDVISQRMITP